MQCVQRGTNKVTLRWYSSTFFLCFRQNLTSKIPDVTVTDFFVLLLFFPNKLIAWILWPCNLWTDVQDGWILIRTASGAPIQIIHTDILTHWSQLVASRPRSTSCLHCLRTFPMERGWQRKEGPLGDGSSSTACFSLAREVTDVSWPDEHLSGVRHLNNHGLSYRGIGNSEVKDERTSLGCKDGDKRYCTHAAAQQEEEEVVGRRQGLK